LLEFSKEDLFEDITDAGVRVYVNYYRDRYQYNFAQISNLCQTQLIKCPIVKKQMNTLDVQLFIPKEDTIDNTQTFPETVNYLIFPYILIKIFSMLIFFS